MVTGKAFESRPLETWREQLRRGALDLAILLSVSTARRRYGLDIIRHLEEFTDIVVGEGTIYPILARLTREGVLVSEWINHEGPHPRKYYRLTDKGRSDLSEMIEHWKSFAAKLGRLVAASGENVT